MSIVTITYSNLVTACKLLESGVKGIRIVDKDGCYPKAFKNYPSSFGAAVTQCGVAYAVDMFEDAGNSEARRDLLPKLIAEYLASKPEDKRKLLSTLLEDGKVTEQDILDAAAVFKVALRMYTPSADVAFPSAKTEEKSGKWSNPGPRTGNLAQNFYKDDCLRNPQNAAVDYALATNKDTIAALETSAKFEAKIVAKVSAPGLIIGGGIAHSSQYEDGLKTGLQFDPISGLPYIPGSSVKGVLRSAFPVVKTRKEKDKVIRYIPEEDFKWAYINEIAGQEYMEAELINLIDSLFENHTDIYADALITALPNSDNKNVLSDDYITPHKDELKNPAPIHIVKVSPGVQFTFLFRLSGNKQLTAKKLEMFKLILSNLGIGAKTNVGYGRLEIEKKQHE